MHPKTTLEQWRALQAVVDHGGYVQAAKHLGRTHSAVNHAVQRLQQQLGVELLELKGRKAQLTATGEVLLRESRQLSERAQSLESLAAVLAAGWETEVTLSIEELYPMQELASVLQQFITESRGCQVRIRNDVLGGSLEAIEQRHADIVVFASQRVFNESEMVGVVSFSPVAHPDHPVFAVGRPLRLSDLSEHLQIAIADTALAPQSKRDSEWLLTEQRITVANFAAAMQLLTRGIGYCFVPSHLTSNALRRGTLKRIPVENYQRHQIDLQMILPKGSATGPATLRLADLFRAQRHAQTQKSPA